MSEIDSLIVQAEEDVESAKKRLAMLKTLKSSMKVSASVSVGVEEAAQMLGISERSVRKMLGDGKLKGYKPNSRIWRVYLGSIKEVRGN